MQLLIVLVKIEALKETFWSHHKWNLLEESLEGISAVFSEVEFMKKWIDFLWAEGGVFDASFLTFFFAKTDRC